MIIIIISLIGLIILFSLATILFFQPRWFLKSVIKIAPGVIYFFETNDPIVAITIDDSPHPKTTPKILEVLAKYKVYATFFIIGERVLGNETIINYILENGHEIGNHLMKDEKSIELDINEFEVQLLKANSTLITLLNQYNTTIKEPQFHRINWFRPGGGWYNSKMIEVAKKHGYKSVLGSIFPYDTHISSSQFASYQILLNLRPGAIIILHDSGKDSISGEWGEQTIQTLETILPEIKRRGYRTVTLSEMLELER
ncbi:polysaccharide deacetylase [Rippkaea orientalis PCC 8801]|uniref:Polysaccharide deacetylase n=1 Tax=Rippkaea orientalis (strain PCC 8801 / RF-1) TaxID=41431 RepID=B7K442_RIPO1|nr:polysaccharide deacetylase family protein [Rippkaea orientalis]ACK67748.1 polysaccharide deacetylase [Rippkaea orientalis PCC 8801]